ncbi:MAG: hypothetical protein ACMG6E_01540, partial [Candidatus Roizmanbacteria bacterium]
ERGAFPLFEDSIYADGKPLRNCTVTTIAPTGSIGILADASGGIEPLFAIAYQHIVKSENRTLTFVNPLFEGIAKEKGFYTPELMDKVAEHGTIRDIKEVPEEVRRAFGTAHEIDYIWHVKMQAAFQAHTDNGVSKTINLSHDATVDDIKNAYMNAWATNCLGITVFRDGCKNEQVLNLGTKNKDVSAVLSDGPGAMQEVPERAPEEETVKHRPLVVEGATYKIDTPLGTSFITVNHDAYKNPFEVFVTIGKAGSDIAAMAEALGRLISTNLRFGNHLPAKERALEIVEQLQGIGGSRSVGYGMNKIRSLPDAIARAITLHVGMQQDRGEAAGGDIVVEASAEDKDQSPLPFGENGSRSLYASSQSQGPKKDLCPSCGDATFAYQEGCKKCYGCGYSEC